MISQETLAAVKVGILTDAQLKEALTHYRDLEKNLKCHGELYHICWKDVFMDLRILEGYENSRRKK